MPAHLTEAQSRAVAHREASLLLGYGLTINQVKGILCNTVHESGDFNYTVMNLDGPQGGRVDSIGGGLFGFKSHGRLDELVKMFPDKQAKIDEYLNYYKTHESEFPSTTPASSANRKYIMETLKWSFPFSLDEQVKYVVDRIENEANVRKLKNESDPAIICEIFRKYFEVGGKKGRWEEDNGASVEKWLTGWNQRPAQFGDGGDNILEGASSGINLSMDSTVAGMFGGVSIGLHGGYNDAAEKTQWMNTAKIPSEKIQQQQEEELKKIDRGQAYPVIVINDHYLAESEIQEFSIESGFYKDYHDFKIYRKQVNGFLPTMRLVMVTKNPKLFKQDAIKCGDVCSVFFHSPSGMVKSYRGDFIITNVSHTPKESEYNDGLVIIVVNGELYLPTLRDETQHFEFSGSARNAAMDAADRLGVSFFFCDAEDTNDKQIWQCASCLSDYVQEIGAHAYKDFNSFYDCWIDPRYGLTFLNINKMLGETGLDEPIDLTVFQTSLETRTRHDKDKARKTPEESKQTAQPQVKIMNNIQHDDESASPYYVCNWKIINKASEITNLMAVQTYDTRTINSPGFNFSSIECNLDYSMPVNQTKLDTYQYYLMVGPGQTIGSEDQPYIANKNMNKGKRVEVGINYVNCSQSIVNETAEAPTLATTDVINTSVGNSGASGNVCVNYYVGFQHNMKNILQLQKQILQVELKGLNLSIMRGEKIPVILMDNDKLSNVISVKYDEKGRSNALNQCLYVTGSGWFIIDGIKWEFKQDEDSDGQSMWRTYCNLTRREWPIPTSAQLLTSAGQAEKRIKVNFGEGLEGNVVVGTEVFYQAEEVVELKDVKDNDSGLHPHMLEILAKFPFEAQCIEITSGRRWAIDEKGKMHDGPCQVQTEGGWKCKNNKGEELLVKDKNDPHIFGLAIDFIAKAPLDENKVLEEIMKSNDLLDVMFEYDAYLQIEKLENNSIETKHFHMEIISSEKGINDEYKNWWIAVNATNKDFVSKKLKEEDEKAAAEAELKKKHEEEKQKAIQQLQNATTTMGSPGSSGVNTNSPSSGGFNGGGNIFLEGGSDWEVREIPEDFWENKMTVKQAAERIGYKQSLTALRGSLRIINVKYIDYNGAEQTGQIMVDASISSATVKVFKQLYESKYKIAKVRLMDNYNHIDATSMGDNNSSGFCLRMTSENKPSKHGTGMAIDINPYDNPCYHTTTGQWEPDPNKYKGKTGNTRSDIQLNDVCYNAFINNGFKWGGSWKTLKDYQHFEK